MRRQCSFTENTGFTFTYQTATGLTGAEVASVDRIDRQAPTASLRYTPAMTTSQPVLATLTLSETGVVPGRIAIDGKTFVKYYTANTTETISFTDVAGNAADQLLTISRIQAGNTA
ncbi:MAG: hypothetical protein LBG52_08500 [Candidatus Peribacteria bacterium]|nr:hypothetical protein [Candidatus Peribacteria bacterium]